MAFWAKETMILQQNRGIITPFNEKQIDCAAYTLRMGAEFFVTPDSNAVDLSTHTKKRLEPIDANGHGGAFQIPPGQFAFLLTEEYLRIPNNMVAFISLKTHPKWGGLVNVSGFHVDGGFEGNFIFAVYNAGPRAIHMERGQDLFLIWFAELDHKNTSSYRRGKLPQTEIDPKLVTNIASPILSSQSMSRKISDIEISLQNLQNKIEVYSLYGALIGFGAGLLPGLIYLLVKHWGDFTTFLGNLLK